MKTIGLIGGMSWESSIEYYRIINQETRKRLGALHSAKSVMISVDFAEMALLQAEGRWEEAAVLLAAAGRSIEAAGADFIVLCTNTMHKVAAEIQSSINIPLLHIADATAGKIKEEGIRSVALLGTRFTMEEDFYKGRLKQLFGLEVLIPDPDEIASVNRIIYDELCVGKILPESQSIYTAVMEKLVQKGARGIILGCTEIGLLVKQADSPVPLFDTTGIHAEAAVRFALEE
ncbi:MAG: aspartate/glutamate racemase family protein [Desulfobacteraceae bacterium]|nr:MAG: aspartate/glutamate racemase family protein [Desulfobacteraceae bacterium]